MKARRLTSTLQDFNDIDTSLNLSLEYLEVSLAFIPINAVWACAARIITGCRLEKICLSDWLHCYFWHFDAWMSNIVVIAIDVRRHS